MSAIFCRFGLIVTGTGERGFLPELFTCLCKWAFLANMLEAYYFADHASVNSAAGGQVLLQDYPQDVEMIRHPKSELKQLWPTFDEVQHGWEIVQRLDVNHVLARPEECCWLRAIFAWCIAKLLAVGVVYDPAISNAFCLPVGCREPLTANQ